MTTRDIVVAGLWIVSALLSVGLTIAWFWKFRGATAFSSVVCTTIAGVPGITLLVESAGRYVERSRTGTTLQAFEFPSTLISCFWFLVGPILLISGLLLRVTQREAPRGTTIVQLTHIAMWGWSTFIGLMFAATV